MSFKLTYATMFDPPAEMHTRFEAAVDDLQGMLGRRHALHIDGRDRAAELSFPLHSPIDTELLLGEFPAAGGEEVALAVAAAGRAWPAWRATPLEERVRLSLQAAALIEQRIYHIAAALCWEVGKNRLEALGEAQESADFFRLYAEDFQRQGGFERALADDPVKGFRSRNRSVLRSYGVWAVIAPFNFPLALAAGPSAAALVTGNTVVLKGASQTPWAGRLLADCLRDAGFPPGVFNYVTGPGSAAGEALATHDAIAGITFTGSHAVGMRIARHMVAGRYPRPCIAEMGGKNACIVTAHADLTRAVPGIVRSAYGMGGQKCSALSRVYVHDSLAEALIQELVPALRAIRVGNPLLREHWLGPVISAQAVARYQSCAAALAGGGARILYGGTRLEEGALARGHYVAPLLAEAVPEHPLFAQEMFLPALMLARVPDLARAVALCNATDYGLCAGIYGSEEEARYFLEHIEAGVTFVNRPQGATTGSWPGYQAFTGWKGSGSTGKAIGSYYYLPQYLREQSQTRVE